MTHHILRLIDMKGEVRSFRSSVAPVYVSYRDQTFALQPGEAGQTTHAYKQASFFSLDDTMRLWPQGDQTIVKK